MPQLSLFRHVRITGLVCAVDVVLGLVKKLLKPDQLDYLLINKFSQDHLELSFNAVRRCGGWNNNPSVQQFQHIFRRLVTRCGVTPGAIGNFRSMDDNALLQASTTYVPPTVGSEDYVEDVIGRQTMLPEGMLNITSHPVLGLRTTVA